jgi:hypothetical protein
VDDVVREIGQDVNANGTDAAGEVGHNLRWSFGFVIDHVDRKNTSP